MSNLSDYVRAGQIAREALTLAVNLVEEGVLLLEVAEKLESLIVSRGAFPAFPVNISINDVAAHYSPGLNDTSRIPPGALVKVDVGVHVNGYIVDAAVTISLSEQWTPLAEAAREALKAALAGVKHDALVNDIAAAVTRAIESRGFKPIKNLTGHMVDRFVLHAGKTVPNTPGIEYSRVKTLHGEVYAIEPFATTGRGYVVDKGASHIYRVVSTRKLKSPNRLNEDLETLWKEFKSLPFSERWLTRLDISLENLHQLVKAGRIYHYPRLVEVSGGLVSQFEDTVIVLEEGCKPLAGVLEISTLI